MESQVVITGIGVVSALGNSIDEIFVNLRSGNVFFDRSAHDDSVAVSPVQDFHIREIVGRNKNIKYLNRGAGFAVASAVMAVNAAGLEKKELQRAGLFIGQGPNLDLDGEFPEIKDGPMYWDPQPALWMLKFLPNTAAAVIAMLAGVHGENLTVGNACAASLQAIGEGYRKIKDGYLDMAVCGGGDSRLSKGGILAYKKAQALCTEDITPSEASRPFDEKRNGFVPGEGGACFVLESLAHALQRRATIYGEICGYGVSMDGYNMTAPAPDGVCAAIAVNSAIKEAGIRPEQISAVSSHGTGTLLNDKREADLLNRIFAGHRVPVIALKSCIGHLASACGCTELAICLSLMKHHYLPEIRNLSRPCDPQVNFVRKGFNTKLKTMLIENFGFGGQNCALVVKHWAD
jgi:3-oxoacyl-[acyl-carrier-protein] synthase II